MKRLNGIVIAVIAIVGVGVSVTGAEKKPTKVELAGQAKIGLCQAVEAALKAVPEGVAYEVNMEREKGKPVFEVFVLKDGKTIEVEVDAADGSIAELKTREEGK